MAKAKLKRIEYANNKKKRLSDRLSNKTFLLELAVGQIQIPVCERLVFLLITYTNDAYNSMI